MTTAATVAIAVYLALITAAFAWIVRCWRRECRLAEQMHLVGHEPRWARRTLNDIHALPTATRKDTP